MRWLQLGVCLVLAGCGAFGTAQGIDRQSGRMGVRNANGEWWVKLDRQTSARDLLGAFESAGYRMVLNSTEPIMRLGWLRLRSSVKQEQSPLSSIPGVLAVEEGRTFNLADFEPVQRTKDERPDTVSYNDPEARWQYALLRMFVADAHAVTQGSPQMLVGVLDTGCDVSHPDFKDREERTRIVTGRNWMDNITDVTDRQGHGTHVTGIVGASANNGVGVVGMAPRVRLLAEKVFNDKGEATWVSVANGLVHAVDQGAKIINLSLGDTYSSGVLEDAVKYALARNVVVIAASGNNGQVDPNIYPASLPGVIAVGATDKKDERASFSNQAKWLALSAPGQGIFSTFPVPLGKFTYGYASGTSMAAPHVAGIVALMRDRYPTWTVPQLRARLLQSVDDLGAPGFDPAFGHGRLNARKALS
jgi:thermitase